MSQQTLYDRMKALTAAQLDDLSHSLELGVEYLPGRETEPATRAAAIHKLVQSAGPEAVATLEVRVSQIIARVPSQSAGAQTPWPVQYRPKVRAYNRKKASIDDYYDDFAWIWQRDLVDRLYGVLDLGYHIFDHASRVCRAVRLERPRAVIDDLADTSVWMMSLIAQCRRSDRPLDKWFRFSASLSDLIWNRYPGMCPLCFDYMILNIAGLPNGKALAYRVESKRKDIEAELMRRAEEYNGFERCTCLSRTALHRRLEGQLNEAKPLLDAFRMTYAELLRQRDAQVKSIPAINTMFAEVFENSYYVLTLDTIASHFFEKVGTMMRALKDTYTYDEGREVYSDTEYAHRMARFQEEIADVFSWMFATQLKITSVYYRDASEYLESVIGEDVLKVPDLSFVDVIWSKYGRAKQGGQWDQLKCPGCDGAPCACNRDLRLASQ